MKNLFYWMVFQVLVGIWLVISPFVLGYRQITNMTINDLVFGAIVAIIGIGVAFAAFPELRHAERKSV
ncbi:MAG: SPW repeat protein [Thermodesulfobacteriota bacterium]